MDARPLRFCKMHGLGNDFVVIDNRDGARRFAPGQVRAWGDRRTGVGFDQLLIAEAPRGNEADFAVRIFNRDGSEARQCGNGMRCMALFARRRGLITGDEALMETPGGPVRARVLDDAVTVSLGVPRFEPEALPLQGDAAPGAGALDLGGGERVWIGAVSLGNPHAVLWVDEADRAPVSALGPRIQASGRFPEGVNVGFAQHLSASRIRLRVYERGAGETRSCGSGACAAVVVGRRQGRLESRVRVDLRGGSLRVEWPGEGEPVWLIGDASHVFDGEIHP